MSSINVPFARATLLLCTIVTFCSSPAQLAPVDDFGPPMDIPMILSGNFGEFRRNHFHTGIDIKTQGVQGKHILSVADGFVSRIKISPRGYGRALYIDHPNGYTSVYAHLRVFNDSIEAFIRSKQYEMEVWDIDFYPEPGDLMVEKGELIALSGNSGSSAGPHLHFEIRETVSEHPLNPLKMGFDIDDDVPPTIQGLRIYPLDDHATIEGEHEAKSFTVKGSNGKMRTVQDTISANGTLGVGLHAFDRMSAANNKCGIYQLRMDVDGAAHYAHTMDELDFETFRYVNTHKDYTLFKEKKWRYHKCFMSDNNALDIYDHLTDDGRIQLIEGEVMPIHFEVEDANGNSTSLDAVLKGEEAEETLTVKTPTGILCHARADNAHRDDDLIILIPQGCLYDDVYLNYRVVEAPRISLSRAFKVHDVGTPLQDKIRIKIKPNSSFSDSTKLLMLGLNGGLHSLGGVYKNGWVECRTKAFGTFAVGQDLKSPVIGSVEGLKPKSGRPDKITVKLSDNLAGVDSIRAEVDGQWLMMRHNTAKSWCQGRLSDLGLHKGEHVFTFYAVDAVGNETKKVVEFVTK